MQDDKRLLYEVVADSIIEKITQGEYEVGEYIPTERELAEKYQVSRGVIREAVRVLNLKGYVDNLPGGKRVVINNESTDVQHNLLYQQMQKAKIEEFLDARTYLDDIIVMLACQRATDEDIEQIEQIYLRLQDYYCDGKKRVRDGGFDQFHLAIAEAAHNNVLECIYRMAISDMLVLRKETLRTKKECAQMVKEHEDILLAIKERNILGARLAIQVHNRNVKERYKKSE